MIQTELIRKATTPYEKRVFKVFDKLTDFYGCWKCGSCCIINNIEITKPEFINILKIYEKTIDISELEKNLFYDNNKRLFLKFPCVFLKDDKCLIYDHKPFICKSYPFQMVKGDNKSTTVYIHGYTYCGMTTQMIDEIMDFTDQCELVDIHGGSNKISLNITGMKLIEYYLKRIKVRK